MTILLWSIITATISAIFIVGGKLISYIRSNDKELQKINLGMKDIDIKIIAAELQLKEMERSSSHMFLEIEKALFEQSKRQDILEKENKETFKELNNTLKELSDALNKVNLQLSICQAFNSQSQCKK